jgi:hypothetical protein
MFRKTPDGFAYDNWWVVPHNPYLTKMFNAHINVEVFIDIQNVKKHFKYVYKGPNRVTMVIATPTMRSINTLTLDIWALLKGSIPY